MDFLASFSEDNIHGLLEPPSVAYSNVTVRRAFVVWMYCGQKNRFKDVCNYFHYLEALEEKLTSESRASSRNHEFHLFTNQPPKSSYLTRNFPHLYTELHNPRKETHLIDNNVLRLREFDKIAQRSGTSRSEIVEASKMIRNYCRTNMKSLERFLKEFKEHMERCGLTNTVGNVGPYIKRKMIQAEIQLESNYVSAMESIKKEDVSNSVEESHYFEDQRNAVRKPIILSNKAKDANDIIVTKILTKSDTKCTNKLVFNTEDKKLETGNNVVMDFINKFQICRDNENSRKDSSEKVCDNFLGNTLDYDVTDESKFRSRRFSGSNFIKKDPVNWRNI